MCPCTVQFGASLLSFSVKLTLVSLSGVREMQCNVRNALFQLPAHKNCVPQVHMGKKFINNQISAVHTSIVLVYVDTPQI